MRETARFSPFLAISYSCEGIYDLSTTTPGPGTPPANSRRAKQFWSRPHGLYLFLSVGLELLDYGRGMTYRLLLSYWSPGSHM